jgi:CheY-like chemotaxis protein
MAKRILVIDDEEDVITYLTTLLEENGYETLSAMNGKEGLERIKSENPDLICLDILMPEKSGISLYRELKKDTEHNKIPVVIVTGFKADEYPLIDFRKFIYERAVPGPDGYIDKPIDKKALLDTIKNILN